MKRSKSLRRQSTAGIDSTLIQLYGKAEVQAAPPPPRQEWPSDPKGRVERLNEGLRRKNYKLRNFLFLDDEAPLENDPDKVIKAIKFFLWYVKACRFTVRMALRKLFRGLHVLGVLCRRRTERRRRMLLDMVDRWRQMQAAAWRKMEEAMSSPTYHIRHSTSETLRVKETLKIPEAEMYAIVKTMYYEQRSKFRSAFNTWYAEFEPIAAEMSNLKQSAERDLQGQLKQADAERLWVLRRRYVEVVAMKPLQDGMDKKIKLKDLIARRNAYIEVQSVSQRAETLDRVVREYRAEVEKSRAFHEKLEADRMKELLARQQKVEEQRAALVRIERQARTVHSTSSAEKAVDVALAGERALRRSIDLGSTQSGVFCFDDFSSDRVSESASRARRPSERGPRVSVTNLLAACMTQQQRRRSEVKVKVIDPSDAPKHNYKRESKIDWLPSCSDSLDDHKVLVEHLVRRRSSVATPELKTFFQDRADEPRFHVPVESTVHIRATNHQPIADPQNKPHIISNSHQHTTNTTTTSADAQPRLRAASAEPRSKLQEYVHREWMRRRQAQTPTPSSDQPAAALPQRTLGPTFAREPAPISISPPVANATAPLVAVPLNERTKEVAGDAYEPSFVVMSRETVRQLAHQREAANQQVLKHRATSAAHAHASFASRATQRRAAEAIAETMAKISRLHPNQ